MTILYGWNSYILKRLTPEQLGATYDPSNTLTVEYRQKYAHLFFIPLFPIGRFWAVRTGGKLYEPSAELLQALNGMRVDTKQWVWAWTGPLLGLIIFIFASISEKIQSRAYEKESALQTSLLNAFFHDTTKTLPLADKIGSLRSLVDSATEKDEFSAKKIDTTTSSILKLFIAAKSTQIDSLTGYTPENTIVVSHFHGQQNHNPVIEEHFEESLWKGQWTGYRTDTTYVFGELRKVSQYQYVMVVKETNRVDPQVTDGGYNTGYAFANVSLIDAHTRKVIKQFKVMAMNSDKISEMSMGSSSVSNSRWMTKLQGDLTRNLLKEAGAYVFEDKDKAKGLY